VYAVIGGTGNIGRRLVVGLLERGQDVRVLTRDVDRARALFGPEAGIMAGDLSEPGVAEVLFKGVDGAYLATPGGPDQVALEKAALDAAADAGVSRLLKISVPGADPGHYVPYARWQFEIEQHLAALGLPATVLRPSWFTDNFLGSAATIAGQGAVYGSAGAGRVGFVDARDIAAVAVTVLVEGGHDGREYLVTGPAALTFEEAAAELATGLDLPVSYVDVTDDELEKALVDASLPTDVAQGLVSINRNARDGNLSPLSSTVQDLTGNPPRSVAEWARDNAAAFRKAS
jgi:uncharacterized protein YbjT (DUF2867 family)